MNTMRSAAVVVCSALLAATLTSAEVVSGLEVGAPTVSIPVLDVTGEWAGKRICYVCEFQDDPNVLAFFKDTGDATEELILRLNELYLQRKDQNFKAVAAIVAGEQAIPWLEELNARAEIEIPLVVLRRGPKDVAVRLYALNPEVENTFLVTVNRFVAANVSAIEPGEFIQVVDATAQMLADL